MTFSPLGIGFGGGGGMGSCFSFFFRLTLILIFLRPPRDGFSFSLGIVCLRYVRWKAQSIKYYVSIDNIGDMLNTTTYSK